MFEEREIPIQKIEGKLLESKNIHLDIKRLDLVHPVISGNKWFKLKYNLKKAVNEGYTTVLSFGGAYSNHIHALAGAAKEFGLNSIGVVRGEETVPLNPTLSFAKECGMEIRYVNRSQYREKDSSEFQEQLLDEFGEVFIIPEGGSNAFAVEGCKEILNNLDRTYDFIMVPVGTGGTMAGLVAANTSSKIIGIPVLKGDFLRKEVEDLLNAAMISRRSQYEFMDNYHLGGYAKFNHDLVDFINNFKVEYEIQLDPIYSGKMAYAFFDLMKKGAFKNGASILLIHTGGIQGIEGFNERFGDIIK